MSAVPPSAIQRDSAVLALYNEQGEVLMQHRSKDALRRPNYWGFFGGGIEEGETPLEALAREIREELEYTIGTPALLQSAPYTITQTDGRVVTGTRHVFIDIYDATQSINQHEGQGMGWIHPDRSADLLMSDNARENLRLIKKYIESV